MLRSAPTHINAQEAELAESEIVSEMSVSMTLIISRIPIPTTFHAMAQNMPWHREGVREMKYAAISAAVFLAMPAVAQDGEMLTYLDFETAVQHVNLAQCPDELAGAGRFCRMTMHNDAFHVFAFAEEGDQPMVGLRSWYQDEMVIDFLALE